MKGHIQGAGNITAVSDQDEKLLFEQEEIEDVVLNHFSKIFDAKRVPVEISREEVDQVDAAIAEIDQMLGDSHWPLWVMWWETFHGLSFVL